MLFSVKMAAQYVENTWFKGKSLHESFRELTSTGMVLIIVTFKLTRGLGSQCFSLIVSCIICYCYIHYNRWIIRKK